MTRTSASRAAVAMFLLACFALAPAAAQAPTPAAEVPPAEAAAAREPVLARVIEVTGDAERAALGEQDWQPCQVGDEYPQETVIRTGVRSSVKLQIGDEEPYTAVVIDSASKTVLTEAFKTADTKRVRMGLGYGRIRAGVAEGGLKSDFTVDSPVATLSKRGTWNFGMFYERGTDRFEVFLLDRGLVEALNEITGERRQLLPGQAVTQLMRRWLDEAQVRRNVPIPDLLGQGEVDVAFNRLRNDGLGVIDPAGNRTALIDLSNDLARQQFAAQVLPLVPVSRLPVENPLRPEGFFGTGRGDELIPVILDSQSALVQQGLARSGTYQFRRSALEDWLQKHSAQRRP